MSIFKNRMAAKYKKVFDNADGQTVLADLMRRAGMVGKVAATKNISKGELAFWAGKRACVLEIIQQLGVSDQETVDLYMKGQNDGQ